MRAHVRTSRVGVQPVLKLIFPFLDGVESKWGSAVGYLEEIGVTQDQMDKIRNNFLE